MKKILTSTLAVVLAVAPIPAQQPTVTFTTKTTLVIIDVAVKDKSGKVIENLRQGDFNLTEDGKPQQLAVFEFQKLDLDHPPAAEARPMVATGSAAQPAPAAVSVKPGTPQPIIRYQDRRLVAMLFDFSSMAVAEQIRIQKAATISG